MVVAAGDEAIAKVNVERSNAVVNDFSSATAEFVTDPEARIPASAMRQLIGTEVGTDKTFFIEATELATRLLRQTDFSLIEVAFMTGFSGQSAFTRAFKRWAGQTPRSFRLQS